MAQSELLDGVVEVTLIASHLGAVVRVTGARVPDQDSKGGRTLCPRSEADSTQLARHLCALLTAVAIGLAVFPAAAAAGVFSFARTDSLLNSGQPTGLGSVAAVANTWTVDVASFSEYVLEAASCATFTAPKLTLGKILPPAGDDTLGFPAIGECGTTRFDTAGEACLVKSKGKKLVCK